mgnify:FL=1
MKTIIGTKQDVTKELTALVADVLARKPEANIAVSAVDLPEEALDALAASDLAFDRATLFQACEYCGAAGHGAHAVGTAFQTLTAAKPFAAVHAPDPDTDDAHAAVYDDAIQAAGGLDLVILGLGERGHVAFNEPGAGFNEKTHIAKLAEVTREAAAPVFGSLEQMPEQGVTIGIHTILGAKKIALVAFGARCAKAVNATLTGRPETFTPASFLQLHTDVEVYLDEAAAAQL